jgi:hypothetical protein
MRIFNNNNSNNNNKVKVNEDLMLVILNCALLYNQNDRQTVPYPCLMVCCKNICLRTVVCTEETTLIGRISDVRSGRGSDFVA